MWDAARCPSTILKGNPCLHNGNIFDAIRIVKFELCWPKFKTGILERSKLESFGRSKLDTRPTVNVNADQLTIQALTIAHPIAIPDSLSPDCLGNAPTSGPTARPTRRFGNRNRRHTEVNKT